MHDWRIICLTHVNSVKDPGKKPATFEMSTKVKKRSVQSQLDQALALQHAGDVDGAESIFRQVLKADARNPA